MLSETYEKKQKMKNGDVLKNLKTEKILLDTIKAGKLKLFWPHQTPRLKYEKHPRRQKTTRQASDKVVRQHQGVFMAQLSIVYEISLSARGVASDF